MYRFIHLPCIYGGTVIAIHIETKSGLVMTGNNEHKHTGSKLIPAIFTLGIKKLLLSFNIFDSLCLSIVEHFTQPITEANNSEKLLSLLIITIDKIILKAIHICYIFTLIINIFLNKYKQ